jgi:hypothetical protein
MERMRIKKTKLLEGVEQTVGLPTKLILPSFDFHLGKSILQLPQTSQIIASQYDR